MRTLLTIALVLMMATMAMAQDETGITGKGIKAGVNLANLSGDDIEADMLLGFAVGGWVEFTMSPSIAIQPELLFSMKGAKAKVGDGEFKLTYIELPILLKYKFSSEGSMKPALLVGPAFGFLMKAEDEDGTDLKDSFKGMDLGIAIGASVAFENESGGGLTIDGRYTLGMSKLDDVGTSDIKNTTISFLVGYGF